MHLVMHHKVPLKTGMIHVGELSVLVATVRFERLKLFKL